FSRYESRNLRRYAMNLTREQLVRVMQRIWEAQRHIRFTYYFFDRNCASLLVDLLRPAIDVPMESLPALIVMPTDVLDTLASTQKRARRAVRKRRELLEELPAEVADTGQIRQRAYRKILAELGRLHANIEHADPARRRAAYRALAEKISQLGEGLAAQGLAT